jgi:hypothetical protein
MKYPGDKMTRIRGALKQWLFPKEFRIGAALWPAGLASEIERMSQSLARLEKPASASSPDAPSEEMLSRLADAGLGLWRLRRRMVDPETDEPLEEMRRAYRHLESTWDALTEAGIEIQDHTDSLFDSGLSLKVIAFQAMAGLEREKVIETIKPTIYYKGKRIRMGEVIVGAPEKAD